MSWSWSGRAWRFETLHHLYRLLCCCVRRHFCRASNLQGSAQKQLGPGCFVLTCMKSMHGTTRKWSWTLGGRRRYPAGVGTNARHVDPLILRRGWWDEIIYQLPCGVPFKFNLDNDYNMPESWWVYDGYRGFFAYTEATPTWKCLEAFDRKNSTIALERAWWNLNECEEECINPTHMQASIVAYILKVDDLTRRAHQ